MNNCIITFTKFLFATSLGIATGFLLFGAISQLAFDISPTYIHTPLLVLFSPLFFGPVWFWNWCLL